MIDNFNGVEVVIFSVLYNNETVLTSVVCELEQDVEIVCAICGKAEVIKINRLFKHLRSITIQENSLINTKDEKVKKEIADIIRAGLTRDICQVCNNEEKHLENQKYLPKDPLRI